MALGPRESGKLIARLAEHVKIKEKGIENVGKLILKDIEEHKLTPDDFSQSNFHPKSTDPWAIDWIFLVDTLNFCFWKHENTIGWTVEGHTGYFALCTAINRAIKDGIDITNPKFYSKITEEQLGKILRSDNDAQVPLLKERVKCLHEVGNVLLNEYNGTFKTCIEQCGHLATKLLKLIIKKFSCYRDEANYKNHRVTFYKRAQILIGDVWSCFRNKDIGHFTDIYEITMFADYRVPQSLCYCDALEYSETLKNILETNMMLENGSEMEVEIRGCSIHAVELIREWIKKNSDKNVDVTSIQIDHFLWDFRRKFNDEIVKQGIPFHKTLCIYY